MTVADMITVLDRHGYQLAGRASKVISDALRWEVRRGRVQRTARGQYRYHQAPVSTARRIRLFARRCHTWIAVAVTRTGNPPPTPPNRRPQPYRRPDDPTRPPSAGSGPPDQPIPSQPCPPQTDMRCPPHTDMRCPPHTDNAERAGTDRVRHTRTNGGQTRRQRVRATQTNGGQPRRQACPPHTDKQRRDPATGVSATHGQRRTTRQDWGRPGEMSSPNSCWKRAA